MYFFKGLYVNTPSVSKTWLGTKMSPKFPTGRPGISKPQGQNLQFDQTTTTRKIFAIYSKQLV